MIVADRRAQDLARPLDGAAVTCAWRLGPTGRLLGPTRTAEKADADDGSEAGNWADNMKSRSAGSKRQVTSRDVARYVEVYKPRCKTSRVYWPEGPRNIILTEPRHFSIQK